MARLEHVVSPTGAHTMVVFATLPDPETIRRTAEEVVRRREYLLDPDSTAEEFFLRLWLRFFELVAWFFQLLFRLVEGFPVWLQYVIVVGLCLILAAILVHMAYSIASLFWGAKRLRTISLTLPNIVQDPVSLEEKADEAATAGDYSLAVRLLFRACLLRLERAESRKLRSGTTNREILRRHRQAAVYEPMRVFVEIIETKWYGMGVCSSADYEICRAAHAELLTSMKGASDVHHA